MDHLHIHLLGRAPVGVAPRIKKKAASRSRLFHSSLMSLPNPETRERSPEPSLFADRQVSFRSTRNGPLDEQQVPVGDQPLPRTSPRVVTARGTHMSRHFLALPHLARGCSLSDRTGMTDPVRGAVRGVFSGEPVSLDDACKPLALGGAADLHGVADLELADIEHLPDLDIDITRRSEFPQNPLWGEHWPSRNNPPGVCSLFAGRLSSNPSCTAA